MKFRIKLHLIVICSFLLVIAGCTSKFPEIKWSYSTKEVTGSPAVKVNNITLDVYIDATTSMQGFAVNTSSVYSQFLDQLEASALSAWQNTNSRYYKFGERIRPVSRTEFLSAKNDPLFYHEAGIFKKTYIDSVVNHTDSTRLSVLVTDLFQDEGDVNVMVESFKTKCFARGVSVGIVGIESEFKGKVFDVRSYPQGYDLETNNRPFYALVFGNEYNMQLLFDALKARPFVKENQLFLISNHIIKSYEVNIVKNRESAGMNNKGQHPDIYSFDFSMPKGGKTISKLDVTITLERNTRCADFSINNTELLVFKKSADSPKANVKDSAATNDLSIEKIQGTGNKITAVLVLNSNDPPGNYSYLVFLKAKQLNGLTAPQWISNFSTDNPVPGSPSGAKTYNLEKLCNTLLVANASVAPTYLAKFYINIFKQ